jgi:hypothetical protein
VECNCSPAACVSVVAGKLAGLGITGNGLRAMMGGSVDHFLDHLLSTEAGA